MGKSVFQWKDADLLLEKKKKSVTIANKKLWCFVNQHGVKQQQQKAVNLNG